MGPAPCVGTPGVSGPPPALGPTGWGGTPCPHRNLSRLCMMLAGFKSRRMWSLQRMNARPAKASLANIASPASVIFALLA